MWLQLASVLLSCNLLIQVTFKALLIISKSGMSKPPFIFGPIILLFDFGLVIPNQLRYNGFNRGCKLLGKGEYRCVVDELGQSKAFKNDYAAV